MIWDPTNSFPSSKLFFVRLMNKMLKKRKQQKVDFTRISAVLHFEQTNSQAKHIIRDTRRCMYPSSLESLLVLKFHSDLRDIKTVNSIIKRMDASSLISGGGSGGGVISVTTTPSNASVTSSLSAPSS